jgi:hypothetical protein
MNHLVDSGLLAETAEADALGFLIAVNYPAIRLLADELERQLGQILDAAIEIFDPALYREADLPTSCLSGVRLQPISAASKPGSSARLANWSQPSRVVRLPTS